MADIKAETTARRAANFGFAALFFALLGWINLELLMLMNSSSIRGQLLTCSLGLYLSVSAYRKYQTWWLPIARSAPETKLRSYSKVSLIGNGFMLVAVGSVTGYLANTDLVVAATGAGILMFVPWSKSKFCKEYFLLSHGLLVAGALPVLVNAAAHQHPIIVLAYSWIFWSYAASLLLITLWLQRSTTLSAKIAVSPKPSEAGTR
jgi:hypothetical protein